MVTGERARWTRWLTSVDVSPAQPATESPILTLRPVRLADEDTVLRAHVVMLADGFEFAGGYRHGMPFEDYVTMLDEQRRAHGVSADWVPSTFLLAEVDDVVVGRTWIRHRLNDRLLAIGGHIGYGVLPEHRRRGHATEILRQSLVIARSFDIRRVLVVCDVDNEASARTIERCGGVLENIVDDLDAGPQKRRYWID